MVLIGLSTLASTPREGGDPAESGRQNYGETKRSSSRVTSHSFLLVAECSMSFDAWHDAYWYCFYTGHCYYSRYRIGLIAQVLITTLVFASLLSMHTLALLRHGYCIIVSTVFFLATTIPRPVLPRGVFSPYEACYIGGGPGTG